jgi:hypothetical protein
MTIMNKTYTPELAPEVLLRLGDYAEGFQDLYRYPTQFAWSGAASTSGSARGWGTQKHRTDGLPRPQATATA